MRRFQSLLIIIEAKKYRAVDQAAAQLLTYLACLRESRIRRCRTDSSVYGVATDGYLFDFVMITHDGHVRISKRFDVPRDMLEVLGCLRHILEKTSLMSPNSTPGKDGDAGVAGDHTDYDMNLDNNQYSEPNIDAEDDD